MARVWRTLYSSPSGPGVESGLAPAAILFWLLIYPQF